MKLRWYISVTALCMIALSRHEYMLTYLQYIICGTFWMQLSLRFGPVLESRLTMNRFCMYDNNMCTFLLFAFVQRCVNTSKLSRNEHKLLLHTHKYRMNHDLLFSLWANVFCYFKVYLQIDRHRPIRIEIGWNFKDSIRIESKNEHKRGTL